MPVIAVFTKYDQFRRNIEIDLEDQHCDAALLDTKVERIFNDEYLANLEGSPPFVRLKSEDFVNQPTFITLIAVPQICTIVADGVRTLLKRLPTHSLVELLPSCSWLCRRIIWN